MRYTKITTTTKKRIYLINKNGYETSLNRRCGSRLCRNTSCLLSGCRRHSYFSDESTYAASFVMTVTAERRLLIVNT